jgi:hypothetical protein
MYAGVRQGLRAAAKEAVGFRFRLGFSCRI